MFTELPDNLAKYLSPKAQAIRAASLSGRHSEAAILTMEHAREVHARRIEIDFNPEAL